MRAMHQEWEKDEQEVDTVYFLRTQRLQFRRWRKEDVELALGLWGDIRVTEFIGGPFPEADIRARLAKEIDSCREHGVQYWPVFTRDSGQHVGCCGLRPRSQEGNQDQDHQVFELGFHIRPEFWRQGYAEEAARAVVSFAFDEPPQGLGASALFAGHNPRNAASRALLTKLGFQWTHDELYPPTGLQHPSYLLPSPVGAGTE